MPRGAGRSPVLVLWALESLSPCLLQQTCRSRCSRAFMTTLSWWPGWMLRSSVASCHICHPSAPSFVLPSRNTALCTASSPLSLSSGKTDHVISDPGRAAIVWDITGQVQRACALAEPELCRRTALIASHNFIVKRHCKLCHGLPLPQVPNCWSHGNTLGFQLSVCLEEVVDFMDINLKI